MTPELAALLDGEVAQRFGRPTIGDEPRMEMRLTCGGWDWFDDEYLDDLSPGIAQPIADALWLAHLLQVCGERNMRFGLQPRTTGCIVTVNQRVEIHGDGYVQLADVEVHQPTILAALAAAMLAVPENKP